MLFQLLDSEHPRREVLRSNWAQFVVIQGIAFQGLMIDPDSMHHLIRNLPHPSLLTSVGLSAIAHTKQAVVVDPGRNPTRILREIDAHELPAPVMGAYTCPF